MYYYYQKRTFTDLRRDSMIYYAGSVQQHIFHALNVGEIEQQISHDPRFSILLLDERFRPVYVSEKKLEFPEQLGFSTTDAYFYYVDVIELDSFKKVRYIVVRAASITPLLEETRHSIYLFLIFSILFLSGIAYALSNLFLEPVRVAIAKLDGFIRDTGHELNTPISVITMSVEQLNGLDIRPEQSKHIQRINVAARTLSHLYNDLTFLLMHDRLRDLTETVDMLELCGERIEYFRPIAEGKKIFVVTNLSQSCCHADRNKLSRVIDNLLSNAIKYTRASGTITVTLDPNRLSVSDNGIGITPEQKEKIFSRYTRFDDANGGFGIGLDIVRMVCDEYGFHIDVESVPGEGSTFSLSWGECSH